MRTKFFIAILFTLYFSLNITPSIFSQKNQSLKELVKETMNLQRQRKYWSGLSPFKEYITKSPQEMIANFKPYTGDSLEQVRSLAYDAIGITGQKSTTPKIRQSAVDILIAGSMDKEASIRKNIGKMLSRYLKSDFTPTSKQKLADHLKLETIYFQNTIKLIGFLDMNTQIPALNNLLNSDQITDHTLKWDIQLSLARLGDKDAVKHSVDLVRNAGINDKVIYNFFPDLSYTRSKEAVDYMIEILNRDTKDCFSPNPDNPVKISCAYQVMEYLAPIIKDFPLQRDKNGELIADDYEKALISCREWFKQHTNDFIIDKQRF